jgi:hypothetical protein
MTFWGGGEGACWATAGMVPAGPAWQPVRSDDEDEICPAVSRRRFRRDAGGRCLFVAELYRWDQLELELTLLGPLGEGSLPCCLRPLVSGKWPANVKHSVILAYTPTLWKASPPAMRRSPDSPVGNPAPFTGG